MAANSTLTDQELIALLPEGNGKAFAEIYNRYWELLYRHARKMTKDDCMAKDVVQDVFISLWDKASEMEFEFSVNGYLYATVRNRILNLYQKQKVRAEYINSLKRFIETSENQTDYLVRTKLLEEKIEAEIFLLPKKMREIFQLSRKSNMTYKEIADNLDLSDKTVKKQISNALKILRVKFGSLFSTFLMLF
jgi:RNA polymerase sigma-70 factor (family 1)